MYGAVHSWEALKAAGHVGNNHLLMGPWRHSGFNYNGSSLGALQFDGDTALQMRRDVLLPFFNHYLKDGAPTYDPPAAIIYNSGENRWDRFADWPLACEKGCPAPLTPIYLQGDSGLGFAKPRNGEDSYVSDPAKPVPHLPRPVNFNDGRWGSWLVTHQRSFDGRIDM